MSFILATIVGLILGILGMIFFRTKPEPIFTPEELIRLNVLYHTLKGDLDKIQQAICGDETLCSKMDDIEEYFYLKSRFSKVGNKTK